MSETMQRMPACLSHRSPAVAADMLAATGFTRCSRFGLVLATPSPSFTARTPPQRRLDALATKNGAIRRLPVSLLICLILLLHCAVKGSAAELADPTRPQGWQAATSGGNGDPDPESQALVLQGVYAMAGQHSAVINGQRVQVGDRVRGAQVLEIDQRHARLLVDGKVIQLGVKVIPVKTPVEKGAGLAATDVLPRHQGGRQ